MFTFDTFFLHMSDNNVLFNDIKNQIADSIYSAHVGSMHTQAACLRRYLLSTPDEVCPKAEKEAVKKQMLEAIEKDAMLPFYLRVRERRSELADHILRTCESSHLHHEEAPSLNGCNRCPPHTKRLEIRAPLSKTTL